MKFLIHALAVFAVLTCGWPFDSVAQDRRPPGGIFNGVPRNIDFIKNSGWTQVILQGKTSTDELVAQTKKDRIQSLLLTALSLKSEVAVEYVEDKPGPSRLTSVSLNVKAKDAPGNVLALSIDEKDNYCRADIVDQSKKVKVWTMNARMQSILETAVRQSIPVQEFAFDAATMEITRGKVNVELRK